MDYVISMLNMIRQRPAMFLGELNIDKLYAFVGGYTWRQQELFPNDYSDFNLFRTFLDVDYGHNAQGWSGVLLNAAGSQRAAIELFYTKLDEFVTVLEEIKQRPAVAWTEPFGDKSSMRFRCIRHQLQRYVDEKRGEDTYMSDYIVKIIPTDPHLKRESASKIEGDTMREITETLQHIKSDLKHNEISFSYGHHPEFVDCGSNLHAIYCPTCREALDFGWWGQAMDKASESQFENLAIQLPCCGGVSTLNDLVYDMPCGFASFQIQIANPSVEPTHEDLRRVEKLLEHSILMINAHY